jgi:hypothetical protein
MASLGAITDVYAKGIDDSNDRLAGLVNNVQGLTPGALMKALTVEQAISSFCQGGMNKIKDEGKGVQGYGR